MSNIPPPPQRLLRQVTVNGSCCVCNAESSQRVDHDNRGRFYYCYKCIDENNLMNGHYLLNGVVHSIYNEDFSKFLFGPPSTKKRPRDNN